ncbi:hypothetical protein D9M68_877540 [compost metagenome]
MGRVVAAPVEVVAHPGLHIPERGDGAAIESLDLGAVQAVVDVAFALGLPPEAVDVAAGPALDLPTVGVGAVAEAGLEVVDDDRGRAHVAVL